MSPNNILLYQKEERRGRAAGKNTPWNISLTGATIYDRVASPCRRAVEVEVEEFREDEKVINIRAVIHVSRESQKGIIIGHQGKMLKKVGSEARWP